jgi:EAL domain-containing protein (putative c-di-GMP-specific phosphodiesterase class I)
MAVNLSARQLKDPDLVERVLQTIAETRIDPRCLDLEITESVLIEQPEAHQETMSRLRAAGVQMSIDDFGTGYSSLSYLKQFPIDRLKLDQSFVRGLPGNPDDLAISSAVLAMAKAMNLKVIAEGVESEAQVDLLFSRHCDELQGYYFAQPLPADELARFVSGRLAVAA